MWAWVVWLLVLAPLLSWLLFATGMPEIVVWGLLALATGFAYFQTWHQHGRRVADDSNSDSGQPDIAP